MITVLSVKKAFEGKELVELACTSSDTKPTEFMNGSMCIEVDTGDIYIFDEENNDWNKIGSSSGGGDDSSDEAVEA